MQTTRSVTRVPGPLISATQVPGRGRRSRCRSLPIPRTRPVTSTTLLIRYGRDLWFLSMAGLSEIFRWVNQAHKRVLWRGPTLYIDHGQSARCTSIRKRHAQISYCSDSNRVTCYLELFMFQCFAFFCTCTTLTVKNGSSIATSQ